MITTVEAQKLKPGDAFRLPRKRKWRYVKEVAFLSDSVPEEYRGMLLVILSDCRQYILQPSRPVLLLSS